MISYANSTIRQYSTGTGNYKTGSPYSGNPANNDSLSPSQIAGYWLKYGGNRSKATIMTAIALAESSGQTDVVNSIGCVGLWQINQPVHPELGTTDSLKNPANNAKAAGSILRSQGLTAWQTYTNGAYKQFMTQAASAVQAPGKPIDSPSNSTAIATTGIPGANAFGSGVTSGLSDLVKAIGFIFSLQFLYIVAGGVLLVVALVFLLMHSNTGKQVVSNLPLPLE